MRFKVKCYQCGRARSARFDGLPAASTTTFRDELKRSGWWTYSPRMRFCPACATSAKLALGVIFEPGGVAWRSRNAGLADFCDRREG